MAELEETADLEDAAARRYEEALSRHGVRDLQPTCRDLLRRLKAEDERAYDEGVARYRETLLPTVASGEADPVGAWIDYGAWLCEKLGEGRCVAVDESGRAESLEPGPGGPWIGGDHASADRGDTASEDGSGGRLVLFLPSSTAEPAVPIAVPSKPSDPQRVTAELLCP